MIIRSISNGMGLWISDGSNDTANPPRCLVSPTLLSPASQLNQPNCPVGTVDFSIILPLVRFLFGIVGIVGYSVGVIFLVFYFEIILIYLLICLTIILWMLRVL